jgi:integrase
VTTFKRHLSGMELKQLRQYLTWCEIHAPPHLAAWGALLELMLYSGLRTDEAVVLTVSSIDAEHGMVHIVDPSKGSNKGTVTVPHGSMVLRRLVDMADIEGLGPTMPITKLLSDGLTVAARKKAMQRLWARTRLTVFGGNVQLGLHALRHTFVQATYKGSGSDLRAAQLAARHKSITSTERYITGYKASQLAAARDKGFGLLEGDNE